MISFAHDSTQIISELLAGNPVDPDVDGVIDEIQLGGERYRH